MKPFRILLTSLVFGTLSQFSFAGDDACCEKMKAAAAESKANGSDQCPTGSCPYLKDAKEKQKDANSESRKISRDEVRKGSAETIAYSSRGGAVRTGTIHSE